jgi:hypothetical protein
MKRKQNSASRPLLCVFAPLREIDRARKKNLTQRRKDAKQVLPQALGY